MGRFKYTNIYAYIYTHIYMHIYTYIYMHIYIYTNGSLLRMVWLMIV